LISPPREQEMYAFEVPFRGREEEGRAPYLTRRSLPMSHWDGPVPSFPRSFFAVPVSPRDAARLGGAKSGSIGCDERLYSHRHIFAAAEEAMA